MTGRKVRKAAPKASGELTLSRATIAEYFDVTLTNAEAQELGDRLREVTGLSRLSFWHSVEDPAAREIERLVGYQDLPNGSTLVHIARQLGVDHRPYARNEPKISLDPFIAAAKRAFPEFRPAKNAVVRSVQRQKLWSAFVDWQDENCPCGDQHHTFCSDRFEKLDLDGVALTIARYNETRPKLRLV